MEKRKLRAMLPSKRIPIDGLRKLALTLKNNKPAEENESVFHEIKVNDA